MDKANKKYIPQALSVIMWETYKTKEFLPLIGLNKNTFHQWTNRGVTEKIEPIGTGNALELNGHDIVYLAALVTLSNMGFPPSIGKYGLRTSTMSFTEAYVQGLGDQRYCVGKTFGANSFIIWELDAEPLPAKHGADIAAKTFAEGSTHGRIEHGWIVLDLLEIADFISQGLRDIYYAR